jgi:quinol monooxygenase YgiN
MNTQTYSPIVELRQYTLHPGKRETLIELFDREFIETQEAVGIQVIGQFRDLDDPDRFVWLRGFNDMPGRAQSLSAFYSGPVWKEHRNAANATMIDSDNVLLLRPARLNAGFSLHGHRLPSGSASDSAGLVSATICHFDAPAGPEFISYFETVLDPVLTETGASTLAYFVTHDSVNTFPALPVREGEHVFVWFSGFQDQAAHKSHWSKLTRLSEYTKFLRRIPGKPEQLRLSPTSRSRLR